jgi:hypothetical protein
MIAARVLEAPIATAQGRRQGIRHRRRVFFAAARRPRRWSLFWDDREAIRLKIALLVFCVIAAGFLEVRW